MSVDGDCRLTGFRSTAVLRDGTPVCVRAIRPDDKERLRVAFARLSAHSVYQRFFHPVNELAADDLRRLTEIDFRDHVGIVLTVGAGTDGRLIAVGRYIRVVSGGDLAEVAFTVADDYQHLGAATLLLGELVAIAREHGVREFVALVLDDNRQMLEVFRRSKLPMRESFVDGVRHVVLNLHVAAPANVRRRPHSGDLRNAIQKQWRRIFGDSMRKRRYVEWIASSHTVRELRKGALGAIRSRAPAIPAGSEA